MSQHTLVSLHSQHITTVTQTVYKHDIQPPINATRQPIHGL